MQGLEGGTTFAHALTENPRIMAILSQSELNAALDPTTYIGNAPEQVDQVIAQVNAKGWLN
ncbi:hypothetical protein ACM3CZ_15175 [Edwardsiella ictaluri]